MFLLRGSLSISKTHVSHLSLVRLGLKRTVKTSTVDWKPIKTNKTPDEEEGRKGRFGKGIVLGLMVAMPIISFYLGTWQVRRLEWKTNLIAKCENRLTYDPIPLPKKFTPDMCQNWEYRRVILKGRFLHDEEMFVGPRVRNGQKGYLLFTPFIRKDTGEKVLIERGWVSEEKVSPQSRTLQHLSLPHGDNVEVVCLVRVPHERGSFQWEKADKNSRLWQVPDIFEMTAISNCAPVHFQALYDLTDHSWKQDENHTNAIAQHHSSHSSWKFWKAKKDKNGSKLDAQQLELQREKQTSGAKGGVEFQEWQLVNAGVPIGKMAKIDLKNNHLQYIFTWYGLSFLSTIFLIVALRKYRRGGAVSQAQLKHDKLKHAKKYM